MIDSMWDEVMICEIYTIDVSSFCYLNCVDFLNMKNRIIHVHIFVNFFAEI
jgi:hypothetical protein